MTENMIIIGAGPAGLSAAIYAARANQSPLVIKGRDLGGQIATTDQVENYPGFPDGIAGPELVELMRKQAIQFGARIDIDFVIEVNFKTRPFQVKTENGYGYEAKSIIVTTGASPRKLNVPGEKEFAGRGVSYCATCDGFFFRNKEIAVVGGGDSALQEGLFLTKFASRVHLIHRRDALRAQSILQDRARANPKIDFIWNSAVKAVKGNGKLEALVLENTQTRSISELSAQGLFVYIGHTPNTALFKGQLEMDAEGYLKVDARLHTSVPGVFAAGESHDHVFRQAVVSAGYGAMAEMEAEKFLAEWEPVFPGSLVSPRV